MVTARPDRRMDPYAGEFWEFTKQREFRLQTCSDCGAFRWPPAAICDRCLSEEYDWTPVSGEGRILSWVVFQRQYFPEYPAPHIAIAAELAEGPIFIANPIDLEHGELHEGMRVQIDWAKSRDRFGEYNLPVFRQADA